MPRPPELTAEINQVLFFTENADGYNETLKSLKRIEAREKPWIPPTKQENWFNQSLASRDFFTNQENYFARLKEINQPVLIGGAKDDLAFPPVDSYLLASEMPIHS